MKLVSITKQTSGEKKYVALFTNGKSVRFGARGYEDFTTHKDPERKERYRKRHAKDLETKDPTRAGFLSWYILWNKPTIKASIADYKKRFNL
jgi:hypothetical protein